jgi:hypothetical protein
MEVMATEHATVLREATDAGEERVHQLKTAHEAALTSIREKTQELAAEHAQLVAELGRENAAALDASTSAARRAALEDGSRELAAVRTEHQRELQRLREDCESEARRSQEEVDRLTRYVWVW